MATDTISKFINKEVLRDLFPRMNTELLITFINGPCKDLFRVYQINTKERLIMFFAQMAHESGGFRWLEERISKEKATQWYEGRRTLGNVNPGDGYRFRGRGIIQLTGRWNYHHFGKILGYDFEDSPALAADPYIAVEVALEYWDSRSLNSHSDRKDMKTVTRKINGGYNGLADRQHWYEKIESYWDSNL